MFEKKKQIKAYTVERCGSCGKEVKRRFCEGDCLFAEAPACPSCGKAAMIERIFGEAIDR